MYDCTHNTLITIKLNALKIIIKEYITAIHTGEV